MNLRIIPLLACACLAAACGSGDSARRAGAADGVRLDTAAGFRVGMLLPEAREAAAARGDVLECEPATSVFRNSNLPDSVRRGVLHVDYCEPPGEGYHLMFDQGSLRRVTVGFSPDWERVPLDTLIGRLSARAGKPAEREVHTYEDGRRELLVSWYGKGIPGLMMLRCPPEGPAHYCEREHYPSPE